MTTPQHVSRSGFTFTNGVRIAFGIGGIVAVVLGILILVAPLKTASVITGFIAAYAIIAGVIYLSIGIFSKNIDQWRRIGHIVLGALFIVAGVVAFINLGNSTAIIATIVAILIGVAWVVEGIVALTLVKHSNKPIWVVIYAVLGIIAGIMVVLSPFTFAAMLWLILGISLIVLGVVQIIRGFSFTASNVVRGA